MSRPSAVILATIPNASPTTVRITGIAAILAPLLLLASSLAYITDGNGINDGHVGGTIGVWSCFAFLLAFIGIHRVLEPEAPRAAPLMLVVATIGAAAGVGFNIDGIMAAEFGRDAVDDLTESSAFALLAYLPWGLFFPIGLIGTGVLMWRTNTFSRISAGLTVCGGVLFVTSRPARIDAAAVLGDCALILALVPIGWALLATPSVVRTTSDNTPAATAAGRP